MELKTRVIIIEGMVKTSRSYRKCIESKKGTEQMIESQTALKARNALKNTLEEMESFRI